MVEMEMPTPCERCGEVFDLLDGVPSPRTPRITICAECADSEQEEMDSEEEIQELRDQISDAEYTIKEAKGRLIELGVVAN